MPRNPFNLSKPSRPGRKPSRPGVLGKYLNPTAKVAVYLVRMRCYRSFESVRKYKYILQQAGELGIEVELWPTDDGDWQIWKLAEKTDQLFKMRRNLVHEIARAANDKRGLELE